MSDNVSTMKEDVAKHLQSNGFILLRVEDIDDKKKYIFKNTEGIQATVKEYQLIKYLKYDELESKIFIPNEMFDDLQNHMKKAIHIPVAYSFYYLASWLYRYAKYYDTVATIKKMKRILGYNPESRGIDYIFKKNGILDTMGYTSTDRDFPYYWNMEDPPFDNRPAFTMFYHPYVQEALPSDYIGKIHNKFVIKTPIKGLHRYEEDLKEGHENGTFFEVDNTTLVPFEVFLYCMANDDLGCTAFYLYSYIKMKNQIFGGRYDCPMIKLAQEVGLSNTTMKEALSKLRQHRVIDGIHNQEYFCVLLPDGERKANTYIANDYIQFAGVAKPYDKIKVLEANEYLKLEEEKKKEVEGESFPVELLPF